LKRRTREKTYDLYEKEREKEDDDDDDVVVVVDRNQIEQN